MPGSVAGARDTVGATIAHVAHVARVQTASCRPEISFCACVAFASGRMIRTVDALAAAADVASRGFRVQSLVIDTAGRMAVTLTWSARVAGVKWFVIV